MTLRDAVAYKRFPFVRLLVPFITGIFLQWYLQPALTIIIAGSVIISIFILVFAFLPQSIKFRVRWLQGSLLLALIIFPGMAVTYLKDIRHNNNCFEKFYKPGATLLLTIQEPLVEKNKSFKAIASVNAVKLRRQWITTSGRILIYLKKEQLPANLTYGSQLIIQKSLQQITNSGNPGALDYKRYCLFQNITSQVFISANQFVILPSTNINKLQQFIFNLRDGAINVLKKYIPDKKQQGVAEALLIGYKNDLDKELVQSYTNTGVVHIIAISGLHLGMIYWLMLKIFSLYKSNKKFIQWLKPVSILLVIWLFTLVTGAPASILRAAVMFTLIVIAGAIERKTNIYNTLAASAFCLLVFNPFFLWDVGFQLSYAAVLSIVTFMQPIYNRMYFKNKILDAAWKLSAITLSAQIFTLPFILFHFHQFSNLFWLTNFVAVPLSGVILYAEILLLCFSWFATLVKYIGIVTGFLIQLMNSFIKGVDTIPFAVSNSIQLSVLQALLLFSFITFCAIWLLNKQKQSFIASLCFLALFSILFINDTLRKKHQNKLIIYNVPKQTAIDFISGTKCYYAGDSIVIADDFIRNFHLKPGRILYSLTPDYTEKIDMSSNHFVSFQNSNILLLNKPVHLQNTNEKIPVDFIVFSKNIKINIREVNNTFSFKQLVFDSSNPLWKIERWKKDCDSLHLRFYSVPENGAFITNL